MPFLLIQFLPISHILIEIDLISSPKGGQVFFIHLEDRVVLDREKHESLIIGGENGLLDFRRLENVIPLHGVTICLISNYLSNPKYRL